MHELAKVVFLSSLAGLVLVGVISLVLKRVSRTSQWRRALKPGRPEDVLALPPGKEVAEAKGEPETSDAEPPHLGISPSGLSLEA